MIEVNDLKKNYAAVRAEIAEAACAAGRPVDSVQLVAVSKFHPADRVLAALSLGMDTFGENQVQELLPKMAAVEAAGGRAKWHMIGTLQRNKVRQVVGRVDLIHSVHSDRLLQEIDRRAEQKGCRQDVLLQVNFSGAAQKHGFAAEAVEGLVRSLLPNLPHVRLQGLMTMAEPEWNEAETEAFFRDFAAYFEQLKDRLQLDLPILSMGMSGDYKLAIRYGATHIRVGTAIFGQREY